MWVRRRWSGLRRWVNARSRRVLFLLACGLMLSPCGCCIGFFELRRVYLYWAVWTDEDLAYYRQPYAPGEFREGLPSVARRLVAEMSEFDDPDAAIAAHPDWYAKRFSTGEWVFGHGIDSHGFGIGAGTTVVKDSRGRVRVYFGHVCGTNGPLEWIAGYQTSSLAEFDQKLAKDSTVREWVP